MGLVCAAWGDVPITYPVLENGKSECCILHTWVLPWRLRNRVHVKRGRTVMASSGRINSPSVTVPLLIEYFVSHKFGSRKQALHLVSSMPHGRTLSVWKQWFLCNKPPSPQVGPAESKGHDFCILESSSSCTV